MGLNSRSRLLKAPTQYESNSRVYGLLWLRSTACRRRHLVRSLIWKYGLVLGWVRAVRRDHRVASWNLANFKIHLALLAAQNHERNTSAIACDSKRSPTDSIWVKMLLTPWLTRTIAHHLHNSTWHGPWLQLEQPVGSSDPCTVVARATAVIIKRLAQSLGWASLPYTNHNGTTSHRQCGTWTPMGLNCECHLKIPDGVVVFGAMCIYDLVFEDILYGILLLTTLPTCFITKSTRSFWCSIYT